MPPRVQFSRRAVLDAAFRLTRQCGLDAVNARAIARELGCSTQPIFRAFESMESLKREMLIMAQDVYRQIIARGCGHDELPYLDAGLCYISFAQSEPELFKLLFMRDRVREGTVNRQEDEGYDDLLGLIMRSTGFDRAQAERFHIHQWVYVHGLAVLMATRFISISMKDVEGMMREEFAAMRLLYTNAGKEESHE